MIDFPPENEISKTNVFEICIYINKNNKLLGYFTYLSYKDYKIEWINDFKKKHGKNPTNKQIENFKKNLHTKDYESFVMKAEQNIDLFFKQLVNSGIEKQLPKVIGNSNYNRIEDLLRVSPATKDNDDLKIGGAIYNLHKKLIINKSCWQSFWKPVLISALGSFLLILLFLIIDISFEAGIFHKLYNLIVPFDKQTCLLLPWL